ncbi:NUDIX domain-containing protein [Streptomyces sp. NPDC059708]|uniref:NUDIX domain-containing protein n=1 Tax=Streptomyces sp. NPDC059708 TaxID=3346916 RepID=UPI00368093BB
MSTPEFIREIRAAGAGHLLLLLPGVTAVVFDDEGRVLLGRRADTGRWSVVGGIAEPGEQPAETAVREVYEETAVRCVPERVVLVQMLEPVTYANGDPYGNLRKRHGWRISAGQHTTGGPAWKHDPRSHRRTRICRQGRREGLAPRPA